MKDADRDSKESDDTMSLASWIGKCLTPHRPRPAPSRRRDEVALSLCRLEDRRVLSVAPTAVDDAYFVQDPATVLFVGDALGVLSNDFNPETGPISTMGGTFSTDLGGTLNLDPGGGFTYTPPTDQGFYFVDSFTYTAENGSGSSNVAIVRLFVGEVPVEFDQPKLLPIFGVEFETPFDPVQVDLTSFAGSSLTILDPTGISFDFGFNGGSDFSISGTADAINRALDTLQYAPPPMYSGPDSLLFFSEVDTGGGFPEEFSQFVSIYVDPPACGCEGPPKGELVAVPDEYYVEPFFSGFFVSQDAGLLANDFSEGESFFFAISGTFTTDLGGTVDINTDGSFFYTPPSLSGNFVDSFVYFTSDEVATSNPGFVTLFVGEVPVPEDITVPLAIFNVEFGTPSEMVVVDLSATQGGNLTLLDTLGITFLSGSNGSSSFTIAGFYDDVNFALDTLLYTPPFNYSGLDFINFNVTFPDRTGTASFNEFPGLPPQPVVINVFPIADPPLLAVGPQPVVYQPGVPVPVNVNVGLMDLDGSEIAGLVILDLVPAGVVPSVGQQLPNDPKVYLILPSDLPYLTFTIDASAPASFNIIVIATSIETTNQPGVFGGPGGPLLPDHPLEPRFAISSTVLAFVRAGSEGPPPIGPPPPNGPPPKPPQQMQVVFLLGPLTAPPIHHHLADDTPQHDHHVVALVIEAHHNHGLDHHSSSVAAFVGDSIELGSDAATAEQDADEQGRRSSESPGIYLKKLGSDAGQFARLPEELCEDYARFMDFLKTLPNGDYVVYFKRGGQLHEEAELRQVVVKVRVVNHRLNPDPGEFKPAGEIAEPPVDPNAPDIPPTVTAPTLEERAEVSDEDAAMTQSIAAGMAAIAGWKLQREDGKLSRRVDQLMEGFSARHSRRFRKSTHKKPS